jgi:hypothetical protein
MKIGILTVPFNNNYGGFLQAYALKQVLVGMGHKVVFINRRRNEPHLKCQVVKILSRIAHLRRPTGMTPEKLGKYPNRFKRKYLAPLTPAYYSHNALKRCMHRRFGALVVGSDQVWRYQYAKDSIDDFFFSFVKNKDIRLISYAASFGIEQMDYPQDKLQECRSLLQRFQAISVREDSGAEMIQRHFGIPGDRVKVLIDPALLLTPAHYARLFEEEERPLPHYLFSYVLDDSPGKLDFISQCLDSLCLEQMDIKAMTGDWKSYQPLCSVEKWLASIYYADFVITDSFHGTAFSILFNKPFIVYGNKQRGNARLESLLGCFDLTNRYVDEHTTNYKTLWKEAIDWQKVNHTLSVKRAEAFAFLQDNLNER